MPGPAKNDKLVAAYCPIEGGIKDPKEVCRRWNTVADEVR